MAFQRKKTVKNPSKRPMTVNDMINPIVKENIKALKLLEELGKKKKKIRWF
ncbi:hypothetical protein [Rummeliibacillus sp. TYF-LIM-RU47]|uniref:hypothetical protein n=1 Tax=Rummeliibacillus sp. TYF-LIM-RU47 TaxID=2608406 RepID=UPI0016819DBD|nr:hypothetical protein [Rummeliibacillus sp. TYF-LIM-RU47]